MITFRWPFYAVIFSFPFFLFIHLLNFEANQLHKTLGLLTAVKERTQFLKKVFHLQKRTNTFVYNISRVGLFLKKETAFSNRLGGINAGEAYPQFQTIDSALRTVIITFLNGRFAFKNVRLCFFSILTASKKNKCIFGSKTELLGFECYSN